jgi:hypothetical protein
VFKCDFAAAQSRNPLSASTVSGDTRVGGIQPGKGACKALAHRAGAARHSLPGTQIRHKIALDAPERARMFDLDVFTLAFVILVGALNFNAIVFSHVVRARAAAIRRSGTTHRRSCAVSG